VGVVGVELLMEEEVVGCLVGLDREMSVGFGVVADGFSPDAAALKAPVRVRLGAGVGAVSPGMGVVSLLAFKEEAGVIPAVPYPEGGFLSEREEMVEVMDELGSPVDLLLPKGAVVGERRAINSFALSTFRPVVFTSR
jgi:hypothetical protein